MTAEMAEQATETPDVKEAGSLPSSAQPLISVTDLRKHFPVKARRFGFFYESRIGFATQCAFQSKRVFRFNLAMCFLQEEPACPHRHQFWLQRR